MKEKLFAGIDIGGTKISAAVVTRSGKILARGKCPTPANARPEEILNRSVALIREILAQEKIKPSALRGIGAGVPGIVDSAKNTIMATPNIHLAKFPLAKELRKRFHVPISLGNDVNLGLLGEKWFGAAKNARNVVGLFPGTGLGGAIIIDGKLYTGTSGAAAEIGHMIVEPQGPLCSCGNHGCLEAVAGRWAIERDIRQAVKNGEKTLITHFTLGNLRLIKSKALKKALDAKDPLVTRIMKNSSQALGKSCLSLRHLLNPEVIVLGGGVIEACHDFMLPIIKKVFFADPFFKKIDRCRIATSQLKDDAVILGAIALAGENS